MVFPCIPTIPLGLEHRSNSCQQYLHHTGQLSAFVIVCKVDLSYLNRLHCPFQIQPHQALWKSAVSLFKKHYSTASCIRSCKKRSGVSKKWIMGSVVVSENCRVLRRSQHFMFFTQSKKTHRDLNTNRSITQMNINGFYAGVGYRPLAVSMEG